MDSTLACSIPQWNWLYFDDCCKSDTHLHLLFAEAYLAHHKSPCCCSSILKWGLNVASHVAETFSIHRSNSNRWVIFDFHLWLCFQKIGQIRWRTPLRRLCDRRSLWSGRTWSTGCTSYLMLHRWSFGMIAASRARWVEFGLSLLLFHHFTRSRLKCSRHYWNRFWCWNSKSYHRQAAAVSADRRCPPNLHSRRPIDARMRHHQP